MVLRLTGGTKSEWFGPHGLIWDLSLMTWVLGSFGLQRRPSHLLVVISILWLTFKGPEELGMLAERFLVLSPEPKLSWNMTTRQLILPEGGETKKRPLSGNRKPR